jgi:hypothetical protein
LIESFEMENAMDTADTIPVSERLDYVQAMLKSLSKLVNGAGSPYLLYFMDMAAEQAGVEAHLAQMKMPARALGSTVA